ncbi:MAG TPA: zinc ribbon domain-containing protein [Pyrinomonadaceae bacterium]|nr:zinc ribbon domain-containing protein [Pyrinomonadaceae bacterium]
MSSERTQCPACRAEVEPGASFCEACGTHFAETPAREIMSVGYLLSELARWEEQGIVSPELANELRGGYERRREELRAQLAQNGRRTKPPSPPPEANAPAWTPQAPPPPPPPPTGADYQAGQFAPDPRVFPRPPVAPLPGDFRSARERRGPRRPLLETLADPQTIRLLLYTGAGMLVVGVIIWLRDVLYLKLQEPVVQATLLAIGTIAVTVAGWLIILRTRLRFTGRALTLAGSLLVPVNFWFLVRSGLVRDQGRAWLVCALCSLLYAHTAALLREKLYVYLASVASVATAWTLIYRVEPEAFGLYALSLMALSLFFLHLSRLFPLGEDNARAQADGQRAENDSNSAFRVPRSAFAYQLWGPPLVQVALVGAALSLLFYMPLRLGSSPSLAEGIFRLRSGGYDAGVAMLLSALAAYAAWFTGRHVYADRRVLLYAASTLLLFWTVFLATDAFGLSGPTQLLLLAAATAAVALAARLPHTEALAHALHHASMVACVALSVSAYVVIGAAPEFTLTHGAALAFLAVTYAASSAPRFLKEQAAAAVVFAYASALFASAAFWVALVSFNLRSETLFYAACTLWPFALYSVSAATARLRRETQLTKPFARVADAEFVLLLLSASLVAFELNDAQRLPFDEVESPRGGMFAALAGAAVYGVLRLRRDRSIFGAALMATALLVLVAAAGDALKAAGALPAAWPVATAVIIAAFLLREAAGRLLRADDKETAGENQANFIARLSRAAVIHFITDCATLACAGLWLAILLSDLEAGATSPPAVLFLALLYWGERAARVKRAWPVYLSAAHAGALCLAVLSVLRLDVEWFALVSALALFPLFFAAGRRALAGGAEWLARPLTDAAGATMMLVAVASVAQAAQYLRVGEPRLLAPAVTLGALALLSFGASLWSASHARVRYFRAGLFTLVASFTLACLRAGFDPAENVELYTTPTAVLLLAVAYLTVRRSWDEYEADTTLLLWLGSLLLVGPLLVRAFEYRVLLGVPAPWRDLGVLFAALALVLFGVVGRLRAPVLVGATALVLELAALAVTSVPWLQIRLWAYMIPVGILLILFWGLLEFRREQLLRLRQRLDERREIMRERFGEWR